MQIKGGAAPLYLIYKEEEYMFKIKYLPTGNIFVLPEKDAKLLKEKSPEDYQIIEKNGRKFRDKIKPKIEDKENSIYSKVVEREVQ